MMRAARVFVLAAATALAASCSIQIVTPSGGAGSGTECTGPACACSPTAQVERLTHGSTNRVDLVIVVDNSASMADKQRLFALAVPDLLSGLVNPRCLDETTGQPTAVQPATLLDVCPAGSKREIPPVTDMHVGLLSSSLGTFGADGCSDKNIPDNDHGHLITRAEPTGTMGTVPTYDKLGFLAWDPEQKLMPPGESAIGAPIATPPVPGLTTSLYDLVVGDGQLGCGFESQNEAWYRFLVDPTPYQSIALINNQVETSGIDTALLQQRKDFLRPDSLLVIVNVTDETDTSIKEYSSYPLFAAPELHLPHARQECTTKGPKDPCCASCGVPTPAGCSADPGCASSPSYTMADENPALRAFGLISHKARYGIEFFYQPSRYTAALTSATVADVNGKMVPNPIFSVLDPVNHPGAVRDPSQVLYATITGVPWQLIARQKNGVPDLVGGVSAVDSTQVGGFKTGHELALVDAKGNTFWDDIAGDPENYVPAKSPYMQESTAPRTGVDPITGIALTPPGSSSANPINGHERTLPSPPDDIEYACIFPILGAIDCSTLQGSCDCQAATSDNPLCDPNPADGNKPTLQTRAKAYPGIKHLAIARGMGDQGIVGSICAKQITDPSAPDYGYRPAIRAILDRISRSLGGASCFPTAINHDAQGQVSCAILEARDTGGNCQCDGPSRTAVTADHQCFEQAALADPLAQAAHWDCLCEIPQASGADLTSCEHDMAPTANGWCYVDASTGPALVQQCPPNDRRTLRFVGTGVPQSGATLFIGCN